MAKKIILGLLVILHSCREGPFPDYEGNEAKDSKSSPVYFQGSFQNTYGVARGHYLLWIRNNQFYARVIFSKGPRVGRIHQYIHVSQYCPETEHDLNFDRRISLAEAVASSGRILIPLDGNLSSQLEGFEWFPSSDERGKYYYARSANLENLLKDLEFVDNIERDYFTKLGPEEPLALHKRSLMIYKENGEGIWAIACAPIQVRSFD
jgi:hypothetical protein